MISSFFLGLRSFSSRFESSWEKIIATILCGINIMRIRIEKKKSYRTRGGEGLEILEFNLFWEFTVALFRGKHDYKKMVFLPKLNEVFCDLGKCAFIQQSGSSQYWNVEPMKKTISRNFKETMWILNSDPESGLRRIHTARIHFLI